MSKKISEKKSSRNSIRNTESVAYLLEMLEPLGNVRAKIMFGGWGIYHNDLMFGLVADDIFYLKVDDKNRPDFEQKKLKPFTYEGKNKKKIIMSYFQVSPDLLEDSEGLCKWAEKAYNAAVRKRKK